MTLVDGAALGETTVKTELIRGSAETVDAIAARFTDRATDVEKRREALKAVRIAMWSGPAADAWENRMTEELTKFVALTDALESGAKTLTTFAGALRSGQDKAQDALDKWKEGDEATETARTSYNEDVAAYNTALENGTTLPARPGTFVDPGQALRDEAQEILDEAREAVDEAGRVATAELGGLPGGRTSGDSGWWGSEGEAEGPQFKWDWWDKTFGDDKSPHDDEHDSGDFLISLGKASGGIWVYGGEGKYEDYLWGGHAVAEGEYRILGLDGSAEGVLDKEGLRLNADGTITIIGGKGSWTHDWKYGGYDASVEGAVEASAEGHANFTEEGVHVGGEVFAGGKIEGSGGFTIAGITLNGNAEGWAGAGAGADGVIGYDDGKFQLNGAAGLAWGLGGKLGGGIEVDVEEFTGALGDGYDAITGLFD